MVLDPARGQLNKGNVFFPFPVGALGFDTCETDYMTFYFNVFEGKAR